MPIKVQDFTTKEMLIKFLNFVADKAKSLPEDATYKFHFSLDPVHVEADTSLSKIVDEWNKSGIIVPDNKIIGGSNVIKKGT